MARLYLVRHGKTATTWDDRDPDPGLNEVGCTQAEAMADQLAGKGPLALVTSPLRRTRETAKALERKMERYRPSRATNRRDYSTRERL